MDPRAAFARLQKHQQTVGYKVPSAAASAIQALATRPAEERPISEAQRVLALPTWAPEDFAELDLTGQYKTPTTDWRLHAIQSAALHWIQACRGALLPIGVGHGKGLITMLAPLAVRAQRPLLLVPAKLQETFFREYRKFRPHFKVATNLKVVTYSALSVPSGAEIMQTFRPDLVIADECQELRRPDSARTRRFLHYFTQFPQTMFVGLSGTITKRGLADYAHLAELALGQGSPLPLDVHELLCWANVLDADGTPTEYDWQTFGAFLPRGADALPEPERRSLARERFKVRFRSTPGVVATQDGSADNALLFTERRIAVPPSIEQARKELDATWCRPDGEELTTPLEKFRVESQLSSGFYYIWDWPDGEVDQDWMEARAGWNRCVRQTLKLNDPRYDSPFRIALATSNGTLDPNVARIVARNSTDAFDCNPFAAWAKWDGQRGKRWWGKPRPPTKTMWISDFLVREAVAWAIERLEKKESGIVWYEHEALEKTMRAVGLPVFGAGESVPEDGTGPDVVALSIFAHGTGRNLQQWNKNFILNWQRDGALMEQLVGRTHRYGQKADDVEVVCPVHTRQARAAIRKSVADATYIQETQGTRQKLCYGTWVDPTWQGGDEDEEYE